MHLYNLIISATFIPDMMYDLFIIITLPLLWLALNLFSFIVILLYELGHGIPALIFTNKPVSVFIGTYGDNNSKKLRAGRLTIFIKPKFAYLRQNGLCIYDTGMPFVKQAVTLLGGAAIALALICLLFAGVCFSNMEIYARMVLGVMLLVLLFNLAVNLFPRTLLIKSSERLHYSDGYQLILMMEDKNNYANIVNACRFYDVRDYENALLYLKKIDHKYMDASAFSLMLSCYIHLEHFGLAGKLQTDHQGAKWQDSVTADDYYLLGLAGTQLKHYAQALENFNKAIILNRNHANSYAGRAFVYNALREYHLAKENATSAIVILENLSTAFSNRAYANFMLGKSGEAFNDADKALTLDENNAYACLVMGMCLLEKGKNEKAMENFE